MQTGLDRSAPTWQAHFEDLAHHRFHSIGMARIVALASFRAIKRLARTPDGCVISSMSFKTSLRDAANWSAKPMRLLQGGQGRENLP